MSKFPTCSNCGEELPAGLAESECPHCLQQTEMATVESTPTMFQSEAAEKRPSRLTWGEDLERIGLLRRDWELRSLIVALLALVILVRYYPRTVRKN